MVYISIAGTLSLLSSRSGTKLENTSLSTGGLKVPAYGYYIPYIVLAIIIDNNAL